MLSIGVFPVLSYGQDAIDFRIGRTPYRISLAAGGGALWGQAEEIVYKYSDTDDYLSELLWDLKPLVYLGSSLFFSRGDPLAGLGAAVELSVKFGLPLSTGTMEDRDWYDPYVPDNNYDDTYLTNFSSHDATNKGANHRAMLLDVSGGITIPVKSAVAIKALVSFSYMRFSWIAQDGYREYMREGGVKIPMQGAGITYDQYWLIFSPGLGLSWPVNRVLGLDFHFFGSPLIFAWDEDVHLLTKMRYRDTMRWGLYLEPGLDFSLAFNRYLSLVLQGSWRYISGARGDTTATREGSPYSSTFTNEAGAGYSAFDGGLLLKIALPLGFH
ncbi:hypothetical protein FACS1894137_02650 [Spirochaetia bacterium]|nr:hypothetical protein FACS1894137_02650 [Spirochaetia bacterium]